MLRKKSLRVKENMRCLERKRGRVFEKSEVETLQKGKLKAWGKSLGVFEGLTPREKEKRRSERENEEKILKKNRENGKMEGS